MQSIMFALVHPPSPPGPQNETGALDFARDYRGPCMYYW